VDLSSVEAVVDLGGSGGGGSAEAAVDLGGAELPTDLTSGAWSSRHSY
jgi:hypothetical protein